LSYLAGQKLVKFNVAFSLAIGKGSNGTKILFTVTSGDKFDATHWACIKFTFDFMKLTRALV